MQVETVRQPLALPITVVLVAAVFLLAVAEAEAASITAAVLQAQAEQAAEETNALILTQDRSDREVRLETTEDRRQEPIRISGREDTAVAVVELLMEELVLTRASVETANSAAEAEAVVVRKQEARTAQEELAGLALCASLCSLHNVQLVTQMASETTSSSQRWQVCPIQPVLPVRQKCSRGTNHRRSGQQLCHPFSRSSPDGMVP